MDIKIKRIDNYTERMGKFYEATVIVDDTFIFYAVLCDFNSETWEEADLYVYTVPYRSVDDPSKYEDDSYENDLEFSNYVKTKLLAYIEQQKGESNNAFA